MSNAPAARRCTAPWSATVGITRLRRGPVGPHPDSQTSAGRALRGPSSTVPSPWPRCRRLSGDGRPVGAGGAQHILGAGPAARVWFVLRRSGALV